MIEQYRYPWHNGNRFNLHVDGTRFFPAMLDAIGQARRYVLMEMYLFESGDLAERFIAAFIAACQRGVRVELLLDDYGASNLFKRDRQRLAAAGVGLAYYNPIKYGKLRRNLFRDHRKLLLVDGELAFVGGAGITNDFSPPNAPEEGWHESMLEIRGPCVADWFDVFVRNRNRWSPQWLELPAPEIPPLPGGRPGRVAVNNPVRMEIKRSLLKHLRSARYRIWIATAYFIPSRKVRRALRRAADRGIDVRLLLPGPRTDLPPVRHAARRYYGRLLRHGVRIFEYQPRFMHAKVLMCDKWVSTGSSNLDRWNLHWNLEANQEVADPVLAGSVEAMFEQDFGNAREYTKEEWFARAWHRRFLEHFWGWVDLLMERQSQRRRHQDRGPAPPEEP